MKTKSQGQAGIPESGAPNKKQRFRLRRKLTAALLQVIVIATEMKNKQVRTNRENLATLVTMLRIWERSISQGQATNSNLPLMVPTAGMDAVKAAMARRVQERLKRRRRKGYWNRGAIVVE